MVLFINLDKGKGWIGVVVKLLLFISQDIWAYCSGPHFVPWCNVSYRLVQRQLHVVAMSVPV